MGSESGSYSNLRSQLVGRTVVDVELDEADDGYAVIVFNDGSRLEIRTSAVGDLLLRRGDAND